MTPEATTQLMDFTAAILARVNSPATTRNNVVPKYALAILYESFSRPSQAKTRWGEVNATIIARWSAAGLVYIKKRAWKEAERMARDLQRHREGF